VLISAAGPPGSGTAPRSVPGHAPPETPACCGSPCNCSLAAATGCKALAVQLQTLRLLAVAALRTLLLGFLHIKRDLARGFELVESCWQASLGVDESLLILLNMPNDSLL